VRALRRWLRQSGHIVLAIVFTIGIECYFPASAGVIADTNLETILQSVPHCISENIVIFNASIEKHVGLTIYYAKKRRGALDAGFSEQYLGVCPKRHGMSREMHIVARKIEPKLVIGGPDYKGGCCYQIPRFASAIVCYDNMSAYSPGSALMYIKIGMGGYYANARRLGCLHKIGLNDSSIGVVARRFSVGFRDGESLFSVDDGAARSPPQQCSEAPKPCSRDEQSGSPKRYPPLRTRMPLALLIGLGSNGVMVAGLLFSERNRFGGYAGPDQWDH